MSVYPAKRKREAPSRKPSRVSIKELDVDDEPGGNDSRSPYACKTQSIVGRPNIDEMWARIRHLEDGLAESNRNTEKAMDAIEERVATLAREHAPITATNLPSHESPPYASIAPLPTSAQYCPVVSGTVTVRIGGEEVQVPTFNPTELELMDW